MPAVQTPQRKQLGRELRALRERKGLLAQEVAGKMECSLSKISKVEAGKTLLNPLEMRELLKLYDVPAEEVARIKALAEVARQRRMIRVAPWLRSYVSLEAEASAIRVFHIDLVPGMLQTEEYVRAVVKPHEPEQSAADVGRLVAIRRQWQERLTGPNAPQLQVVLYEAVVRGLVGGPDVTREQLERLLHLSELPTVSIRLIPYRAGAHASMGTSFTILTLPSPLSDVVFNENLWEADYLDKADQVAAYNQVFARLTAVALGEPETREAIEKAARELS